MPIPNIQYAIEVDTGASGVTNDNYAINAGVIRIITGRPGYDGTPTYPTGEAGIGSGTLQAKWHEGWIIPNSLGKPSRRVDPTVSGEYGTLSGFEFSIQNATKIWNYLAGQNVYLANKPVQLYVVIDDVFYYGWNGKISNNPMDEATFKFVCKDKFDSLHKTIPPTTINETIYPDAADDVKGSSIPSCFGDIPYAMIRNVSGEAAFVNLWEKDGIQFKSAAAAHIYGASSSQRLRLRLSTAAATFFEDIKLTIGEEGYYLFIMRGGGDFDPDVGYKITNVVQVGASATAPNTFESDFTLARPLPVAMDTILNNYLYEDFPSADTTETDTWFFGVAKLAISNIVSEKQISGFKYNGPNPELVRFDTESKKYTDVSGVVLNVDDGSGGERPSLRARVGRITKDGDVDVIQYQRPTWLERPNIDGASMLWSGIGTRGISLYARDFDRTTEVSFAGDDTRRQIITDIALPPGIDYDAIDKMYLVPDLDITANTSSVRIGILMSPVDVYGRPYVYSASTSYYPDAAKYIATGTYNFIPNEYYENGDDDSQASIFGALEDHSGTSVDVNSKWEVPSDIVDMLKENDVVPKIRVRMDYDPESAGYNRVIHVKQWAIILELKVDVTDDNLYARVSGELQGANETNSVYEAVRHILENYDGISSSDIDYGNMAAERSDWHIGRQLTDRKSSLDYLKELCRQAWFCIVPKRNGDRLITAWRENENFAAISNAEDDVLRDSIKKFRKTDASKVYNDFHLRYSWNPGTQEYDRSFIVTHTDESSFPAQGADGDGDGIDDWKTYVGGLDDDSYADAKELWEAAHDSYDRIEQVQRLPDSHGKLRWFIDILIFDPDADFTHRGVNSSAYRSLVHYVEWTTRQKDTVEYRLPINSTWITLELLSAVTFNDVQFTNDSDREGWVTMVKIDPRKDELVVRLILNPTDISTGLGDFTETGAADDNIVESGSQTDNIVEGV